MAAMPGLVQSGFQHPEGSFNSAIVMMVASLLLAMGVVTGGGACADQGLEFHDEMVPQRPGMKTADDYQRFVQEHGLPQRPELTPEEMERLRAQSRRELKLEEEYSRRNASSVLQQMSDEDILNAIRLNLDGSYEPPSVDAYENWPKSAQEFEKKYGRPPQRREEVDFYFGDDDDSQDEERANR